MHSSAANVDCVIKKNRKLACYLYELILAKDEWEEGTPLYATVKGDSRLCLFDSGGFCSE